MENNENSKISTSQICAASFKKRHKIILKNAKLKPVPINWICPSFQGYLRKNDLIPKSKGVLDLHCATVFSSFIRESLGLFCFTCEDSFCLRRKFWFPISGIKNQNEKIQWIRQIKIFSENHYDKRLTNLTFGRCIVQFRWSVPEQLIEIQLS